jgi:hypothetical protein
MNFFALLLFISYCGALLITGTAVYRFNNSENQNYLNRGVLLGEILLLGSVFIVGQIVLLSLLHLYTGIFLWAMVAGNYLWLLDAKTVKFLKDQVLRLPRFDLPLLLFVVLLAIFIFRNLYYLSDADSHSTYLYAQKLWLAAKTSVWGSPSLDMRVFVPHFNAVPYALGLSVFGLNTFFPQLVVSSWTVLALILVFGYTSFKIGRYWALAAVMLVLFDEHIYYSGANSCCITNSALIALLFAAGYNFWEARKGSGAFRWMLALIFVSQLLANKYQMFYIAVLMAGFGLFIQNSPVDLLKSFFRHRRYLLTLGAAIILMLLWYVKNFLVTGVPTFPILAAQMQVWNWTPEMSEVFNKVYAGGVSPGKLIKYLSFMFVWPGIDALKIVLLGILFFPFIAIVLILRTKSKPEEIVEIVYWLALSIIFIIGLCLVSFVDPRHYRYGLGFFSFSAILLISYLGKQIFGVGLNKLCALVVIGGLSFGGSIMFWHGGDLIRPSWADNWQVLTGQLTAPEAMKRYFPKTDALIELLEKNPQLAQNAAWDIGIASDAYIGGSPFLLPIKPQVGLWGATVVKWESYDDPRLIVADLQKAGITSLIDVKSEIPHFITLEEYSLIAAKYDRHPSGLRFDYGFPSELAGE